MQFNKPHKLKDHEWDKKSLNGQIEVQKIWRYYYYRNGRVLKRKVIHSSWRDYKIDYCPREPLDSFYRPEVVRPTLTYKKPNKVPLHYAMRVSGNIGIHNYKRS